MHHGAPPVCMAAVYDKRLSLYAACHGRRSQTPNTQFAMVPRTGHGRAGAPLAVYPTERDIEIFKLLVRFRYLPSDYIHAFVGGNEKALSHRLNLLSRKPNLYLARPHAAAPERRRQLSAADL